MVLVEKSKLVPVNKKTKHKDMFTLMQIFIKRIFKFLRRPYRR